MREEQGSLDEMGRDMIAMLGAARRAARRALAIIMSNGSRRADLAYAAESSKLGAFQSYLGCPSPLILTLCIIISQWTRSYQSEEHILTYNGGDQADMCEHRSGTQLSIRSTQDISTLALAFQLLFRIGCFESHLLR